MNPINFPSFSSLMFPSHDGWELKPVEALHESDIEDFVTHFDADFHKLIKEREQITNLYGLETQFHTVQSMYHLVRHILDTSNTIHHTPFMKDVQQITNRLRDEKRFLLDVLAKKVEKVFSRAQLECLKNGESLLNLATTQKDPTALKEMLGVGIPIDALDERGETALMKACRDHNVQSVNTLIEAGANLAAQNLKGETALHIVIENWRYAITPDDERRRDEIMHLLLKAGASISCLDKSYTCPLEEAFIKDLPPTCIYELLARQKAPLQFERRPLLQFIPLMLALEKRKNALDLQNQLEWDTVICRLLDLGANPNRGLRGTMPLDAAMGCGASRVIVKLIEKGAALSQGHFYAGYPHFIELCLQGLQARPQDLVNIDGKHNSLLHIAAHIHDNEGIATILASPFVTPDFVNLQNDKGQSALMVAEEDATTNDTPNILFITHGARLGLIDREGNSLLHLAAKHFGVEILDKMLTEPFATPRFVNMLNQNGRSAICEAARSRFSYLATFEKLIQKGARLDIIDEEGNTLLHHAAFGGSDWLIKKILEQPFAKKEFINRKNRRNQTVLQLVRQNAGAWITYDNANKCQELVALLKNLGAEETASMETEEKKENPPKKNVRKVSEMEKVPVSLTVQLQNLQIDNTKKMKFDDEKQAK